MVRLCASWEGEAAQKVELMSKEAGITEKTMKHSRGGDRGHSHVNTDIREKKKLRCYRARFESPHVVRASQC